MILFVVAASALVASAIPDEPPACTIVLPNLPFHRYFREWVDERGLPVGRRSPIVERLLNPEERWTHVVEHHEVHTTDWLVPRARPEGARWLRVWDSLGAVLEIDPEQCDDPIRFPVGALALRIKGKATPNLVRVAVGSARDDNSMFAEVHLVGTGRAAFSTAAFIPLRSVANEDLDVTLSLPTCKSRSTVVSASGVESSLYTLLAPYPCRRTRQRPTPGWSAAQKRRGRALDYADLHLAAEGGPDSGPLAIRIVVRERDGRTDGAEVDFVRDIAPGRPVRVPVPRQVLDPVFDVELEDGGGCWDVGSLVPFLVRETVEETRFSFQLPRTVAVRTYIVSSTDGLGAGDLMCRLSKCDGTRVDVSLPSGGATLELPSLAESAGVCRDERGRRWEAHAIGPEVLLEPMRDEVAAYLEYGFTDLKGRSGGFLLRAAADHVCRYAREVGADRGELGIVHTYPVSAPLFFDTEPEGCAVGLETNRFRLDRGHVVHVADFLFEIVESLFARDQRGDPTDHLLILVEDGPTPEGDPVFEAALEELRRLVVRPGGPEVQLVAFHGEATGSLCDHVASALGASSCTRVGEDAVRNGGWP